MNFYDNADIFREAASRPAYQKAPKNMPDPDPSEISPGDTESAEEFWQMHKNKHTEDHPAKGNQYGSEKVRRAPEPRPGVGISESHFEKGDKVKCLKSGMTGTVTNVDPEEKGKYYTVKRNDGKVMKYAPDELKALNEAKVNYARVTKGANKDMLKKAMEIGIADFNKGIYEVPLSKELKKMTSGQDMKDQAAYFAAWQKGQMQQRLKEENNMFELDEAVDQKLVSIVNKLQSGAYFGPNAGKPRQELNKDGVKLYSRGSDPFFVFGYVDGSPVVYGSGSGGNAIAGFTQDVAGVQLKSKFMAALRSIGYTAKAGTKRLTSAQMEDWINRSSGSSYASPEDKTVGPVMMKLKSGEYFRPESRYNKMETLVKKRDLEMYIRGGDPFFIFGYIQEQPFVFAAGSGGGTALAGPHHDPDLKAQLLDAIKKNGFTPNRQMMSGLGKGVINVNPKRMTGKMIEDWIRRTTMYENKTFMDVANSVREIMEARRYVSDPADDNMIMQLRKAQDLLDDKPDSATYELTFRGGKKGKMDKKSIDRLLSAHDRIPKAENKRRFRIMIMQSPEAMKKIANDPALNEQAKWRQGKPIARHRLQITPGGYEMTKDDEKHTYHKDSDYWGGAKSPVQRKGRAKDDPLADRDKIGLTQKGEKLKNPKEKVKRLKAAIRSAKAARERNK